MRTAQTCCGWCGLIWSAVLTCTPLAPKEPEVQHELTKEQFCRVIEEGKIGEWCYKQAMQLLARVNVSFYLATGEAVNKLFELFDSDGNGTISLQVAYVVLLCSARCAELRSTLRFL